MRPLALLVALAGCSGGGGTDDADDQSDLATTSPPDFAGLDLYGVDLTGVFPPPDLAQAQLRFSSSVQVYVEPNDGLSPVTNAIKNAKSTIDVEMYLLTDSTITNALVAAQKAGRKVRVVLEKSPQAGSNQTAYTTLANGGVEVHWSNPAYTLTHTKMMIMDGATLWAMTMNFSVSAVTGNREYLLVDTDAADVAEAQSVFDADVALAATPALADLVVSPTTSRTKLDQLIGGATKEIDIEWEELSDNDIASHLQQRIKAGVAVKIVAPDTIGGTATATMLTTLKAGGAQVKTLSNPAIHAKLVLVDRGRGFIGSENATLSSLQNNREVGALWQDATVAGKCAAAFDADWANGTAY